MLTENIKHVLKQFKKIRHGKKYSTKLSYKHNVGGQPLQYITVGNLLKTAAEQFGDRKAIISRHQNKQITFAQVLEETNKLAAGLRLLNLRKGDPVGIWAPNLLEWYLTKMACARAGLITVCLNPAYESPELEYCVNKVGVKTIVCGDKFKNCDYYERLLTIAPELEHCEPGKLKSARIPSMETVISISKDVKRGTYNFEEIMDLATEPNIVEIQKLQTQINPDDPCNLHFTSGTTGKPKGALVSHFSMVNNSFLMGKRNELNKHTICIQVPLFHVFGTVASILAPVHFGSTIVLPNDVYNPDANFDAIKEERCTMIYGTPTMYVDLIEKQEKSNEKISADIAVIGGALSTPNLIRNIKKVLNIKKVQPCYGLSESTAVVFQSLFTDNEEQTLTTVGHVSEHVEVKVIDSNDQVVPFGTPGELCVRSYSNMIGFWNDEEGTRKALGKDGWLKTGDQFILEEDGYGKVVGRLKEMIIRGGENIFPREIEDVLISHPDILEVYVIGLPNERLGEEVCACIRVKEEAVVTLQNIKTFCKGKLAYFKIPSKIQIVEDFPKTTSGKVQKFKLRVMFSV